MSNYNLFCKCQANISMTQQVFGDISRGNLIQSSSNQPIQQPKQFILQSSAFKEEVNSLEVYQNYLYIGTSESKVLVYELQKNDSEKQPVYLHYLSKVYPHCTVVQSIVAVQKYLVIIPKEEQQLIRIWDRNALKLLHGYKGHEKQISKVIFLKNGHLLASVSQDATARIWNVEQHDQFDKEMIRYQGSYPLLAVQQIDEEVLALGGDGCFITLWNWKRQETRCKAFGHPGSVLCLSYYQPYLVSSGGDSKLKIWEIQQAMGSLSNVNTTKILQNYERQRLPMLDLILQKQIKGQLSQNQFFFKLANYRVMIIDSTGNIFYINSKLQVKTQKIEIEYFRKIQDIKIWKDCLLYLPSYENKEQKCLNLFKTSKQEYKEEEASGFALNNALQLLAGLLEIKGSSEAPEGEPN